MELWDLYDKNRQPLGRTHQRGLPLKAGTYHQIIGVWTVHRQTGKILVTQRDPHKIVCPGKWENTGGSVLSGETSLQAAIRELGEETGIQATAADFNLLHTLRTEEAFIDSYLCLTSAPPASIVLQKGETIAYRWLNLQGLHDLVYSPDFAFPIIRQYKACLDNLIQAVQSITGGK